MTAGTLTLREEPRATLLTWLTTTDHKRIGLLYFTAAMGFFLVGGVFALIMRAELAAPGLLIVIV
jgi:cytochrome c oxidase subunit 1